MPLDSLRTPEDDQDRLQAAPEAMTYTPEESLKATQKVDHEERLGEAQFDVARMGAYVRRDLVSNEVQLRDYNAFLNARIVVEEKVEEKKAPDQHERPEDDSAYFNERIAA